MTRATSLLIGSALAGLLIWTAAQIERQYTGGYWATLGLLGVAGLVLASTRLLTIRGAGSIVLSRPTFAVGFLPALIAGGWVLLAAQPQGNWGRDHVGNWSGDMHIGSVVRDLGTYAPVIAFGLGVLLGLVFDRVFAPVATTPPRTPVSEREPVERAGAAEEHSIEERERPRVGARTNNGEE